MATLEKESLGTNTGPRAWGDDEEPEIRNVVKVETPVKEKKIPSKPIARHPSFSELASSSSSSAGGDNDRTFTQPANQADEYHAKGFALRKAGNFLGAIEEYTNALELNPKHFKALFNRGKIERRDCQLCQGLGLNVHSFLSFIGDRLCI